MQTQHRRHLDAFIHGYWHAWVFLKEKNGGFQIRVLLRFPVAATRYAIRAVSARFNYLAGWVP